MSQAVFPISDVINVTVTGTAQGAAVPNVNSVALLTTDPAINAETFGIYFSPTAAAANYGTNTDTAAMAENIYAQNPNLLSGNGQLVIIPMLATVQATHGTFVSANLSANLASFAAVTNGSINVLLDGVAVALTNLNFTGCTTWAQIAAVINAGLQDGIVSANANGITITSKKVGSGSTVSTTANVTGTSLYAAGFLNGAAGTSTAGANATGETISGAIQRVLPQVFFAHVMTTWDYEDAAAITASAYVNSIDMMLYTPRAQTKDIAGLATTIKNASQTKSRVLVYCNNTMHDAKLMMASYVGAGASVDFTGTNTSQTMNLRTLVNVLPDTGLSETLRVAAQTAGCDLYISYQGVPGVVSNGGNAYFDNVYSDLALKFALSTGGFNYLKQAGTKIPQTEPGMAGYKDAFRQVMNQFVNNGCLAPGAWNSSEFFGSPAILTANIATKGFYIYSQPVALQSEQNRQNRIAPLVQIAAKRAGAIHTGNVLVNIND